MEKSIGKEYKNRIQRVNFLKDNCDEVEEKQYMKPYTPEELQGKKEGLANVSIEIAEVDAEMKLAKAEFASRLKPLKEKRAQLVDNIKAKAEYVKEECYRFTDEGERMTGYYNADGDLIECRPATANELQLNLFKMDGFGVGSMATGTNE